MLTCVQSPFGATSGSAGPACITRPSAGDTTTVGSSGTSRSGSLKKKAKKPESEMRGSAHAGRRKATSAAAGSSEPKINGRPARSIFMQTKGALADRPAYPRASV